jgi:hypothetical protein
MKKFINIKPATGPEILVNVDHIVTLKSRVINDKRGALHSATVYADIALIGGEKIETYNEYDAVSKLLEEY